MKSNLNTKNRADNEVTKTNSEIELTSELNKLMTKKLISLKLTQIAGNLGGQGINLIAKVLIGCLSRETVTETLHTDTGICVALPSVRCVRLDHNGRDSAVTSENITLVLEWLLLEQTLAGETDNAAGDTLGL
jgi:hypothetical protein